VIIPADLVAAGYCRDPNEAEWYPCWGGAKRPCHPLSIRLIDGAVWIVTSTYGNLSDVVRLLKFEQVAHLVEWIDRNGVLVTDGANVWD